MITIRQGTFETNSSSTHSMVICTKDEWDKWAKGELYASRWYDGFKTKEEVMEEYRKEYSNYFDKNGNFIPNAMYETFEDFQCDYSTEWYDMDGWVGELECDENEYTTPGGEVIKVICRYGYDC